MIATSLKWVLIGIRQVCSGSGGGVRAQSSEGLGILIVR